MSVKLYKNCILNRQYHDVFYTQGLLETYLSHLASLTMNMNYYLEYQGTLQLTLPPYTDAHNYMKYTDEGGNTNYYFITDWNIKNGVYILTYVIDIWHTFIYGTYWNIRTAHQILTQDTTSDVLYPIINPLPNQPNPEITNILSTQYCPIYYGYRYTGVTDLEQPEGAQEILFITAYLSGSNVYPYFFSSFQLANESAASFYNYAVGQYSITVSGVTYYYNITGCYLLPKELINVTNLKSYGNLDTINNYIPLTSGGIQLYAFANFEFNNTIELAYNELNTDCTSPIFAIGTMNKSFTSNFSAVTNNLKIMSVIELDGFSITAEYKGEIIDITNSFYRPFSFTPDTALTVANRNLAAKTEIITTTISAVASVIKGAAQIYSGVADTAISLATMGMSAGNAISAGSNYSGGASFSNLGSSIANGVTSFLDAANSIIQCVSNRMIQYASATQTASTINTSLLYYNLFYVSADEKNYINYSEVSNSVKYYGWITEKYITSIYTGSNFEMLCCDEIEINGYMPSQFKKIIETIIHGGVRVWMTSTPTF